MANEYCVVIALKLSNTHRKINKYFKYTSSRFINLPSQKIYYTLIIILFSI